MSGGPDDLARLWEWFGLRQFRAYSPLYERIAVAVSRDAPVLELVGRAPPEAHLPPNLLGAVHYLLLDGLDHPLADVYAGRSDADPLVPPGRAAGLRPTAGRRLDPAPGGLAQC